MLTFLVSVILALVCFSASGQALLSGARLAGQAALVSPAPPPPSAPEISGISSSVLTNQANITWSTDVSTTNDFVYFSTDSSYSLKSNSPAGGASHSIWLSNLTDSTTYNFKVVSWGNGLSSTSSPSSFTTASTNITIPFAVTFTNNMTPLVGTNWAVNSSGFVTNYPQQLEMLTDTNFSLGLWSTNDKAQTVFGENSVAFGGTNQKAAVSVTLGYIGDSWGKQIAAWSVLWMKRSITLSSYSSGGIQLVPAKDYGTPLTASAAGTTTETRCDFNSKGQAGYTYQAFDLQTLNPTPLTTATVSQVSIKYLPLKRLTSLVTLPETNVAVGAKIQSIANGGLAGIVLRFRPTLLAITLGDSKASTSTDWPERMTSPIVVGRYVCESGEVTSQLLTKLTNLTSRWWWTNVTPDIVLQNATVNDHDGNCPPSAITSVTTMQTTMAENLTNTWPGIKTWMANPWQRETTTTNINSIIDSVRSAHSDFCFQGPDERVWAKASDNGTNMMGLHGIHYSTYNTSLTYTNGDSSQEYGPGASTCATQWLNSVSTGRTNCLTIADGIYCYYNGTDGKVWALKSVHGTNSVLIKAAATFSAGAQLCASIYTNRLKVFYNGSQVGAATNIAETEINGPLNSGAGLFSTEAGTTFSAFSVSNSTGSASAP